MRMYVGSIDVGVPFVALFLCCFFRCFLPCLLFPSIAYLQLLGLANAAMRMYVCNIDGSVPFVAPDPPANPHAQRLPHLGSGHII